MIQLVTNSFYYIHLLLHCKDQSILWISTADVKDAYREVKGDKALFLKLMVRFINKRVGIRLIHT